MPQFWIERAGVQNCRDNIGIPDGVVFLSSMDSFSCTFRYVLYFECANLDISNSSSPYTKVCSKPYDPKKQIVQYVLMIDAGSTGSRIHVYKFHNCFEAPTLEHETFEQIKPGLSSYANSPEDAAKSLDVLLDIALAEIPKELQSCTPVAVKATAGLRLLGDAESRAILEAVEKRIHAKYPFPLPASNGVIMMDGKDEGVYAWITTNYLLGNNGFHF